MINRIIDRNNNTAAGISILPSGDQISFPFKISGSIPIHLKNRFVSEITEPSSEVKIIKKVKIKSNNKI
jgi:hypothetical protein